MKSIGLYEPKVIEKILNDEKNFFYHYGYNGVLVDNYLFELNDKSYLVVLEKVLNCWSSCHEYFIYEDPEEKEKIYTHFLQKELEKDFD